MAVPQDMVPYADPNGATFDRANLSNENWAERQSVIKTGSKFDALEQRLDALKLTMKSSRSEADSRRVHDLVKNAMTEISKGAHQNTQDARAQKVAAEAKEWRMLNCGTAPKGLDEKKLIDPAAAGRTWAPSCEVIPGYIAARGAARAVEDARVLRGIPMKTSGLSLDDAPATLAGRESALEAWSKTSRSAVKNTVEDAFEWKIRTSNHILDRWGVNKSPVRDRAAFANAAATKALEAEYGDYYSRWSLSHAVAAQECATAELDAAAGAWAVANAATASDVGMLGAPARNAAMEGLVAPLGPAFSGSSADKRAIKKADQDELETMKSEMPGLGHHLGPTSHLRERLYAADRRGKGSQEMFFELKVDSKSPILQRDQRATSRSPTGGRSPALSRSASRSPRCSVTHQLDTWGASQSAACQAQAKGQLEDCWDAIRASSLEEVSLMRKLEVIIPTRANTGSKAATRRALTPPPLRSYSYGDDIAQDWRPGLRSDSARFGSLSLLEKGSAALASELGSRAWSISPTRPFRKRVGKDKAMMKKPYFLMI